MYYLYFLDLYVENAYKKDNVKEKNNNRPDKSLNLWCGISRKEIKCKCRFHWIARLTQIYYGAGTKESVYKNEWKGWQIGES